jgi:hypothetical protein
MEAIFDRFTRAPGGRRSLKTQQHAGVVCGRGPLCSPSSKGDARFAPIQPGSVDMLGPICSSPCDSPGEPLGQAPRAPTSCEAPFDRPAAGPGHCYVLPRKEVIQPQLPLRLPCSRGSPCRHEAWTISSSWSLDLPKTGHQQTALPWMPRRAPST